MSDDDAVLRGETARLIKELGLADFKFDDDEDDVKPERKSKDKKQKDKAISNAHADIASKPPLAKSNKKIENVAAKVVDGKAVKTTDSRRPDGKALQNNDNKQKAPVQKIKPNAALEESSKLSVGSQQKPSALQNNEKKQKAPVQKIKPNAALEESSKVAVGSLQKPSANATPAVPGTGASKMKGKSTAVTGGNLPAWLSSKSKSKPLDIKISGEGNWYDGLSVIKDSGRIPRVDPAALSAVCDAVQDTYESEVTRYHEQRPDLNDADSKWLREVIQSGTLSDRVAALAMQVQRSPLHHLRAFDTMVDMCCKKEQRVAQLAIEATKDLLIHNLLPDRPLVPFASRNLYDPEMSLKLATLSWFEGEIVHRVSRFVGALEAGTMVNADYFKKICLDVSVELLVAKPEQEARLLALIVNKLGDPSSPICQKSLESLKRIVHAHPNMTAVIIKEIRNFISRPHLATRALFSSILFLSQIPLRNDSVVAAQLVECYVSLFEKAVEREESGSRLLYALLTGINRAFPFLKEREPILRHLDALFRIVHSAAFTTSTQALMLISYIALADEKTAKKAGTDESEQSLLTRFYRALYDKLLSSELSTRARNTLFLNLLFRSMKRDPSPTRMMAFVKRLMICITQCASNIAAGFIFLIAEVFRYRPEALKMITELEKIGEAPSANEEMHAFGNFNVEKREPKFAVLEGYVPALWEASLMRQHFHPSVKAFASSWLAPPMHSVKFDGDPITEFSISAFLNRFSYKNPKTRNMEKVHRPLPRAEDPVNSELFVGAPEESISPDKAFFHKYFGARVRLIGEGKIKDKSHRKKEDIDDEGSNVGGEDETDHPVENDEDAEIDKYADFLAEQLMKSAEGNGFDKADIDDDLDFSSDSGSDDDAVGGEHDDLFAEDGDGEGAEEGSDSKMVDSEDGSEDMEFADFSDDDMSDEIGLEAQQPTGKSKKRKNDDADIFASADDYEQDMEEIMQIVSNQSKNGKTENEQTFSRREKKRLKKMQSTSVVDTAPAENEEKSARTKRSKLRA